MQLILSSVQPASFNVPDVISTCLNTPGTLKWIVLLVLLLFLKEVFKSPRKGKGYRVEKTRSDKLRTSARQPPPQKARQAVVGIIPNVVSAAAKFKGEKGESIMRNELAMALPPDIYHVFHDLLIPTPEGSLTQIDHVVLSAFGVFVIETKHYGGWIFGNADDTRWTLTFRGGKKEDRQNPLKQNEAHIRALAHVVDIPEMYFCNLVRMTGDAEFKSDPIPGVMFAGTAEFIRSCRNPLFPLEMVRKMYQQIMMADRSWCSSSREKHESFVQSRIERRAA